MKARKVAVVAAVFPVGLLALGASLGAKSPDVRCHKLEGSLVELFDPETGSTKGTLTNAEWLNGTAEAVFNSAPFVTPDPNKVTFSSTMTITTRHGDLHGLNRVYLFDFVTGRGTDVTDIDRASSTGVFAGATGVVYTNLVKTVSAARGPYHSVVTGRICFPRANQ